MLKYRLVYKSIFLTYKSIFQVIYYLVLLGYHCTCAPSHIFKKSIYTNEEYLFCVV